ncbi:MAG: septum formation initiator family protein [Thermacetogeniaceae bacterium]
MGLLLLYFIHLQNTVISLSYQVEQTAAFIEELKRENKAYELQILKLKSPDRIEYIAREKLGMIEPKTILLKNNSLANGL